MEIERNGQFEEVARTQAGTQGCVINQGLEPGNIYNVRARAFDGEHYSAYTDVLEVKTRPEQVDIIDCDSFVGDDAGNWLINPEEDLTITLDEQQEQKAVVVRSDAHVTIEGQGGIAGSASLNKAGQGVLTMKTKNTYTGATVLHGGVMELASIAKGGQPSSMGASAEFAQNWIMDGGTYSYIGSSFD